MKYRAVCWVLALALSGGCAGLPLEDSPFQRISRARPQEGYVVKVRAVHVPSPSHVYTSATPEAAEVREAACVGLEGTRFRCARMVRKEGGDFMEAPDYVVRLEYDVVDERFFARGASIIARVGGWRRVMIGDEDPAGDAAYSLRWGFRVTRAGEAAAPVFESVFRSIDLQTWHFDIEQWMARYFSE